MTDDEFLDRFARRTLDELSHVDHIRLAFVYARRGGVAAAIEGARQIRGFAEDAGARGKYHDTLTVAWARVIAHLAARDPGLGFASFLDAHPQLRDRALLLRHYSEARLFSDAARVRFVEPDLLPLP